MSTETAMPASRADQPVTPDELPSGDAAGRPGRFLTLVAMAVGKLLAAHDPGAMVEELFQLIRTELRLDVFFNYRLQDQDTLVLEASGGLTDAERQAGAVLGIGQAVCGCAARDRTPVHARDVQNSSDPMVDFVRGMGLSCYACTPLMFNQTVLGTLGFGRRWATRFDDDELQFLHTLCHHVAIAKHRLMMEDDLRGMVQARDLLLHELNHRVRNSLQLVLGLIGLDRPSSSSETQAALQKAEARVNVVLAVHQLLHPEAEDGRIPMGPLLERLVANANRRQQNAGEIVVRTDAHATLPLEQAVSLALVVDGLLQPQGAAPAASLILTADDDGLQLRFGHHDMAAGNPLHDALARPLLRQLGAMADHQPQNRTTIILVPCHGAGSAKGPVPCDC